MAKFVLDLWGRINNTSLPESKYLWPLLEAVVNSIQSIEDSHISDGKIEIEAKRHDNPNMEFKFDTKMQHSETKEEEMPFESFSITDNGNGFTEKNYASFCTADSSLKWQKGCKGTGRFLWLKAFESASIDSIFEEDEKWYRRQFSFKANGTEPDNNVKMTEEKKPCTTVTLHDFKRKYRDKCPKKLDVLAHQIIEHCLIYFILGNCPHIIVRDNMGDSISLNNYYEQNIKDSLHQDHFSQEGSDFVLYHLRVPKGATSHELHLCANGREVRSLKLNTFYPNLQKKIEDETGIGFYYCGYLTSPYLDKRVNTSRTDFDFAEEEQQELNNQVSEKELIEIAKEFVYTYLKDFIEAIERRKEKRVRDFVSHKKPQYRYL
jgi:hypothetical protein